MAKHRFDMKTCNGRIYQHMRKYGPKYFHIVLIRNHSCTSKEELLKEERKEFELYDKNILLNINRPIVSSIEKQELNAKNSKTWYNNNKEYRIKQVMNRYLQNRSYLITRMRKYDEHNKLMKELPFYRVSLTTSF